MNVPHIILDSAVFMPKIVRFGGVITKIILLVFFETRCTASVVVSKKLHANYCTYENDAYRLKSYFGAGAARALHGQSLPSCDCFCGEVAPLKAV